MSKLSIETARVFLPLLQPSRYKGAWGGRGCIHGETLIDLPLGQIKIKDFTGGLIKCASGIAYANSPLKYPPENLYAVRLANGVEIKATAKHKFLTIRGWVELSSLVYQDCLASLAPDGAPIQQLQQPIFETSHLPTSSDTFQKGFLEDAHYCLQKVLNYLCYCFEDRRLCDGQLQSVKDTYLSAVQILAYGRRHIHHALMHKDDPEFLNKNILSQSLSPLSSLRDCHEEAGQNYEDQESYNDESISEQILELFRLYQLSHESNSHFEQVQELAKAFLYLCTLISRDERFQTISSMLAGDIRDDSYCNLYSSCNHDLHYIPIDYIKYDSCDVFYDFFVPVYNHYLTSGIINHNSGKSHFFAENLVDEHYRNRGQNSVCIREIQKTIAKSAKKLIESKITALGLGESDGFRVYNDVIQTPGNGSIIFQGMQDHTAESIKSLEGMDRAWIEEGQTLSATSLQLLRPTIRNNNSEIWASWNARRKTDPIDMLFRGDERPDNMLCVRANYSDNPWFPDVLEQERQDDLRINPDQYPHIWEGEYLQVMVGAYYAKQLMAARQDGRICRVPLDPLMTTRAFWDIGGTGAKSDAVAIWIAQFIGSEIRICDYYESVGQPLATHLNWMRAKGYEGALCVLPHDGAQHDKIESITYEGAIKRAGFQTLVVKNQGTGAAMQRIESARRVFPAVWIDKEKCSAGIEAIGWYHEKRDEARNIGLGPDHDWSSHGSDAFGLMAVAYEDIQRQVAKRNADKPKNNFRQPAPGSWM